LKHVLKRIATSGAFAAFLLAGKGVSAGQKVTALPLVDLNKFSGGWYEIARLPIKREKSCIANVVEVIALGDKPNTLQLVSSCEAKKGYSDVRNANIKAEKGSGGGKLKMTYTWPFSEKDWIIDLSPENEWVVLGTPNHKTLLILSRKSSMGPDVLAGIKQRAASEGFAVDKLIMTLQTGR
jgi:apolipoprotein D and lipocalin family protein